MSTKDKPKVVVEHDSDGGSRLVTVEQPAPTAQTNRHSPGRFRANACCFSGLVSVQVVHGSRMPAFAKLLTAYFFRRISSDTPPMPSRTIVAGSGT